MSSLDQKNETCEICEFTDLEPMSHFQFGKVVDPDSNRCEYEMEVYGCKYCMNTILLKIERFEDFGGNGPEYTNLGDYKLIIVTSNEGRRIEFFKTILNNRETQSFYNQYVDQLEEEITQLYYKVKNNIRNGTF